MLGARAAGRAGVEVLLLHSESGDSIAVSQSFIQVSAKKKTFFK